MSVSAAERLFVYGSLRSDVPRLPGIASFAFEALQRGAVREGAGWVVGNLHAVSWYPGFIDSRQGRVRGEVWLVHGKRTWGVLDAYEGDDFLRQPHRVDMDDGGRVTAWLYMFRGPRTGVPLIPSGDYLDWVRNR